MPRPRLDPWQADPLQPPGDAGGTARAHELDGGSRRRSYRSAAARSAAPGARRERLLSVRRVRRSLIRDADDRPAVPLVRGRGRRRMEEETQDESCHRSMGGGLIVRRAGQAALVALALGFPYCRADATTGPVPVGDSRSWTEAGAETRLEVRAIVPQVASGDLPSVQPGTPEPPLPETPGLPTPAEPGVSAAGTATPTPELGSRGAHSGDQGPVDVDGTGPYLWEDVWRSVIERWAPAEWVSDLVTITVCESGRFDPDAGRWYVRLGAVGDHGSSLGAPQLWRGWYRAIGVDPDDPAELWRDPDVQAEAATYVRSARGRYGGSGGWTCADLRGIP